MTEIKLISKKCFQSFSKVFFGKKKHVPKEHFDESADSGKTILFKKCQQPLSWGLFRQFNEYESQQFFFPHS